jgi:hypothetical protein
MVRQRFSTIIFLAICLAFGACASFEPGLRYQDLLRPRQPTVKQVQEGLEVSIEEFATTKKSHQAFDADLAPNGILPLLIKVENGGTQTYRLREQDVNVYFGNDLLPTLSGEKAAGQSAHSEYAGKALGWTVLTGPFAILLWPATIAGSASHTAAVNRRIEQHFESISFNDALLKPNQSSAGFLYFKLPNGIQRLQNLKVEVTPADEQSATRLTYSLMIPTLELSSSVSGQTVSGDKNEKP